MKKLVFFVTCALISGCETIGNWADDAGSYMPVLSDERCEHWQCFTEGGRQQSEYNKRMMQQRWRQEEMEEKGIDPQHAAMQQQYEQYYQEQVQAGQTPVTFEQYQQYIQQFQQQQQQAPAYNPPPEMNPYDHYEPPIF